MTTIISWAYICGRTLNGPCSHHMILSDTLAKDFKCPKSRRIHSMHLPLLQKMINTTTTTTIADDFLAHDFRSAYIWTWGWSMTVYSNKGKKEDARGFVLSLLYMYNMCAYLGWMWSLKKLILEERDAYQKNTSARNKPNRFDSLHIVVLFNLRLEWMSCILSFLSPRWRAVSKQPRWVGDSNTVPIVERSIILKLYSMATRRFSHRWDNSSNNSLWWPSHCNEQRWLKAAAWKVYNRAHWRLIAWISSGT